MHVVFLTSEYPPMPSGGIGTGIRNVARGLVMLGHSATVLGCGLRAEFDDQGVRVKFLAATRAPKLGWWLNRRALGRELGRLVHRDRADVVEAHDWCGPSAGIRADCPVTIRCHGSATYFAHLASRRVRPSIRWAEQSALRQADAIVAVSRYAADLTRRLFGLERDIGVIPNGVDPVRFSPGDPGEVDPDSVLYFGTLARKKGVLDLPRIVSALICRHPRARLVVVGRDCRDAETGSPSTWSLIERDLPEAAWPRVSYLGPRPHDEVCELIRRAGACLFPSYAEALPVSWIEAMACGKAIVGYDLGWARELIQSGESGVLLPPGDAEGVALALAEILADRERADRLGWAARRRVETTFSTEVVARRMLVHYREIARRPR